MIAKTTRTIAAGIVAMAVSAHLLWTLHGAAAQTKSDTAWRTEYAVG
jgi:hypothetical protein